MSGWVLAAVLYVLLLIVTFVHTYAVVEFDMKVSECNSHMDRGDFFAADGCWGNLHKSWYGRIMYGIYGDGN